MEIKIYDMLVFEDEAGSIYQDCVCSVEHYKEENVYKLNGAVYKENKLIEELLIFNYEWDRFVQNYVFRLNKNNTYKLKEIWSRTQSHTYRKVYELIDGELVHIEYYNGMPVYNKRTEVTYDQVKNFVAEE